MKIAAIQFCPASGDKYGNVEKIIGFTESVKADVIIFPELSTSGYFFLSRDEIMPLAEPFEGETCTELQKAAQVKNAVIVFGFPEHDIKTDNIYNSAAILFPDKKLSRVYRKTHLFYKERYCFSPGNTGFFVVEDKERDLRIGTMICYDWRFPEAARSLALQGADLIICPSNLVTNLWHKVMPARAVENKVYFAVVNRTGTEKRKGEELFFNGESAVYTYTGKQICKAGIYEEQVLYADIYPEKTRDKAFNEYNDLFKDRRPGMYKIT